ncbi:hypothetical protein COCSUDRAFT_67658 [Coccomyxa subellipsoidea C-169]|uniref:Uncharacterized protein n=1 Tax=Coccomyxa subellipsoidea (strain C-169) TaxID=574566 RepID=I0YNL6_COCSC|nr:hypothetical protein COCSUDRAFT_67658 [Coccomyxa subellipsoidea C-169]EIE19985.1 hypothetical protein COCSUDRAFT_67658 [Coccomyxa subellipsoidea C-169]|eukprot:XP_005644529.1 hypothetical protein COCSUDRAFT_67658 [Coccomyxa subellipsoidea C-169]
MSRLTPLLWTNRAFQVLAAATCLAAMASSASAAMDAPVYTKSEDYPLPTGLGSWASVMSEILLNREGGASAAAKQLQSFQTMVQTQLQKLQTDFAAGKPFPDLPVIRDLRAFQGGLDLKPANVTALSVSSAFINYAPCLVSQDAVGAAATAVGLNIVPQVINVAAKGASILPIGININPSVIIVNPQGAAIWPRGVNIQPTLIAVVPTGTAVAPKGVSVTPTGIAVTGK